MILDKNIQKFVSAFSKLPPLGQKASLRLVFWLYQKHGLIDELVEALLNLKSLKNCRLCNAPCSSDSCDLCSNAARDKRVVCVVEKLTDALAIERSQTFNGVYFFLNGLWAPTKGYHKATLPLSKLKTFLDNMQAQEVILGLPFTLQGDATASLINEELQSLNLKITRLARGIPKGAEIDQIDDYTLSFGLKNREREQ